MSDQIHAERREPQEPGAPFDLSGAADELLDQARNLSAGRAARTLTPGAGGLLKQTLVALTAGTELDEHTTPGPTTIQVLRGTATLRLGGDEVDLDADTWAPIAEEVHDLRAATDTVVLLTVAVRAAAS